jgi:hypothetical protein
MSKAVIRIQPNGRTFATEIYRPELNTLATYVMPDRAQATIERIKVPLLH